MATVGGVAGRVPATPHSGVRSASPRCPGGVLDFARRNEEHAWRSTAWVAVLLPLAALVFAVSVLAVKAWPAIRVNGWYFLYGRNWTYGSGYGAIVHTNGVAHPQGAQFGAWAIIWGTLVSSLIAIVIAVPLSIGAAFALTERMPDLDLAAARLHHRDPGRHPERRHRAVGHPHLRARGWPSNVYPASSPTTCPTSRCCATSATRWAAARAS